MVEFVKSLSWHSWCNIGLYRGKNFFVRKTAGDESYNKRLKAQVHKQNSFKSNNLYTPKILEQWYIWKLFYFDMEYINSKTLASYMGHITVKEIAELVILIINTLDIKWSKIIKGTNKIFQDKIDSLKSSLVDITPNENKALEILKNFDFSLVPFSKCHWDLTLENILIAPNKDIYLIDFLDSFFDSRTVDVAKLLQDLELWWSYRNKQRDENLNLRLTIVKHALIESILELPDWSNTIKHIYYILLLNLLRIIPYTKDEPTKNFINNSLRSIMNILANNQFH